MDSPALDVVIGVVLMYAVLSLFVTVLVEMFSGTMMNMRGWTLEMAIKSAFGARSRFDGSVGETLHERSQTVRSFARCLHAGLPGGGGEGQVPGLS